MVDQAFGPSAIGHLGDSVIYWWNEGPMQRPFGALVDPLCQELNLFRFQFFSTLRWRHDLLGPVRCDPLYHFALFEIPGNDGMSSASKLAERTFFGIQTKLGLSLLGVRTMAGEAIVGQNGEDLAAEIN